MVYVFDLFVQILVSWLDFFVTIYSYVTVYLRIVQRASLIQGLLFGYLLLLFLVQMSTSFVFREQATNSMSFWRWSVSIYKIFIPFNVVKAYIIHLKHCIIKLDNNRLMSSRSSSSENSRNRDNGNRDRKKRYKYCCRKCKHAESGKKSCVCVVPLNQRRTQIGIKGCQTCGCKGCSVEDFLSRGEDPEYRPRMKENGDRSSHSNEQKFDQKNGCCRKCMKAFSKIGKSCLCQVPKQVRLTKLSIQGCKICGCTGCNPKDYSQSYSERSISSQPKSVESRNEKINLKDFNLDNVDNSVIGKVIIVQYGLFPGMLGLGIPQRTPNYILGRPL